MEQKHLFEYVDYDRISDDIYFLGGMSRIVLRMNVNLAKKSSDGNRYHFYNEYSYDSKYKDVGRVLSMRRSYDYYLTLEPLVDKMSGVMIRPQDMYLLRSNLSRVASWFSSDSKVFAIKGGKLRVVEHGLSSTTSGFPDGRSITFEPVVMDWENQQSQGTRLTLAKGVYSDISIDRFFGFMYIMNSFDMVQSAQAMLAFMGRPDIGTNRSDFDNAYNTFSKDTEVPEGIVKERKAPPVTPKKVSGGNSFFDKIDNMGG